MQETGGAPARRAAQEDERQQAGARAIQAGWRQQRQRLPMRGRMVDRMQHLQQQHQHQVCLCTPAPSAFCCHAACWLLALLAITHTEQ